jgi:hypothetical protein
MSEQEPNSVNRSAYIAEIARLYVDAPDTPSEVSRTDWVIANQLYTAGVPIITVRFAFHLVFLRRYLRNLEEGFSAPILSLAYFRMVISKLTKDELDPFYMDIIADKYASIAPDPQAYIQRIKDGRANLNRSPGLTRGSSLP